MKKLLIISIIAMVTLTGCGSSINKGDDLLGNKFTVKSFINGGALGENVYVLIDKKSGVNYYYITEGNRSAMSPIYDKEGKVVIDKVEQE